MQNINTYVRVTAVLLLVVGIYACDQPTTQVHEEQNEPSVLENEQAIESQYIVVFKDSDAKGKALSDPDRVEALRNEVLDEYSIDRSAVVGRYNVALKGFAAKLSDKMLAGLKKDDRIKYIEKDRFITLAPPGACSPWPSCKDGDGGGDSGQVVPWGVQRIGGATGSNGTAWVIDTGVDLDHPDLNVDTGRSAVFVSRGPGSGSPDDGNGHGTHVAGTIAALDNDIDVVGVAAGATVVAVKVLDDRGSGSYSGVIGGIDYVAANAAPGDVANMSLGGSTSDAVDDAVRNAADQGIYFAVAAGNDGADANNYSPARVEYKNVWTVSATDDTDAFASFSNWSGPTDPPVEFAAPGVDILSLWLDGGTDTISGTSMASPHVAGLLLVTNGSPASDGTASGDPDGDPDPIAHN
ncbi:S8 family serine peptidase [Fodinibius sediminis]|uniref:Peptidase inhibitor I9 n=1 Tax=Fodinibius sediminis TaxID=1214077 RepID=A0A521EYA2_9BACT|nr:S8 family serine peptidase [Fodinibius sediminis]SMO89012.1 Peptidase inhibitor I9 [Fodinibius sediminis]